MVFLKRCIHSSKKVVGNANVILNYFEQLEEGGKAVVAKKLYIRRSCFSSLKRECVETREGSTLSCKAPQIRHQDN